MTHPRGWVPDGIGLRADYRKGRTISVRQVDWMLSGIGAVRGLERRTASAGTHHQAGKFSAALLISGSAGVTDEPYDSRMAESVPPLDGATWAKDRQSRHGQEISSSSVLDCIG
jgi:hypothetical protein